MQAKMLFLNTISPLHAGSGQGVGVIELPITREKATGIPFVPGSSLKGVLRDACDDANTRDQVFGPNTGNADLYAGAVNFTDLRLSLLPVRSLKGVFAWVTSPLLLRRLARDVEIAEGSGVPGIIPNITRDQQCTVCDPSCIVRVEKQDVVLEELVFEAESSKTVEMWATWIANCVFANDSDWQQFLKERFCVVSDDVMSFFLEYGTQVDPHIAMEEDRKTAKQGALWHQESLPVESILTGLVIATFVSKSKATPKIVYKTVQDCVQKPVQLGGSATSGKGLCRIYMLG